MKIPKMANAIGYIDEKLITGAEEKKKRKHWRGWGAVAACLAVLVITGMAVWPSLFAGESTVDETGGRYKDYTLQDCEDVILWPWESRTVYEQYTSVTLDDIEYRTCQRAVSKDLVGELIGTHSVTGYDYITDEEHTSDFEVYQLKYADKSQFVAVKMEDTCYVFKNESYSPPNTLGELFDRVNLPEAIALDIFSENGGESGSRYFSLSSDDYVWKVLTDCEKTPFVEDDRWTVGDREYLSFTVTSETLGVYKVAMYVTADGYLWTNAFGWQYLFHIGTDAAGEIIKYAKENSTEAAYEPYRNTVVGIIAGITGEYILVDDSILCKNPADGIAYKIMLNDLRISRYVEHGVIKTGDTVQITYEGKIEENTVNGAISVSRVVITGEDVLIPE